MEDTITISREYYEYLLSDQAFLSALQAAGVDNWEGYEYACRIMDGEDADDLF